MSIEEFQESGMTFDRGCDLIREAIAVIRDVADRQAESYPGWFERGFTRYYGRPVAAHIEMWSPAVAWMVAEMMRCVLVDAIGYRWRSTPAAWYVALEIAQEICGPPAETEEEEQR